MSKQRFINGVEVTVGPIVLGTLNLSRGATGTQVILLADGLADALSIVRGSTDMMLFDSSTPQITITPNTIFSGQLTINGNRFYLADDARMAFGGVVEECWIVYDEDGTDVMEVVTPAAGFSIRARDTGASQIVDIGRFIPTVVNKDFEDDLFDVAGLTDSATIWQQPANSRLIAVIMRLETQFAGPSLTDMRVTMGLAGDTNGLLVTTGNLVSDSEDTEYAGVGAYYAAFTAGLSCLTASAIDWIAYATATGCNMNALTAGSIDFYFLYLQQ